VAKKRGKVELKSLIGGERGGKKHVHFGISRRVSLNRRDLFLKKKSR